MDSGTLGRKLKQCNKNLRIWHPHHDFIPSALLLLGFNCSYESVCGIDKNEVPEFTIIEPYSGRIIKAGWRRTLNILVKKNIVTQESVRRVFGVHITGQQKQTFKLLDDPIKTAEKAAKLRGMEESQRKYGVADPDYRRLDDLVDIAKMYKKEGRI
jgi:hypothetical protein